MRQAISLLFLLFICINLSLTAQNLNSKQKVELELAIQHYQKKEFEQAIHYLEPIFERTSNKNVYQYLYNSYLQTEDFKQAEKIAKRQQKRFPTESAYQVNLGFVYSTSGEREKAIKLFEDIIDNCPQNQRAIIELANEFIEINELEFAEQTYIKGKKKIKT